MSLWKKTMFVLGLGPDEDYEAAPPPLGQSPELGVAPPAGGAAAGGSVGMTAPVTGIGATTTFDTPPATRVSEVVDTSAVRPLGPMDGAGGLSPVGSTELTAAPLATNVTPSTASVTPEGMVPLSSVNTVRPLPVASSAPGQAPHQVVPQSFNDAQEVADRFRNGAPVIVNLQTAERELSRRLIDFASGLCYGLNGQMEKVGDRVYLLTPEGVELSPDRRRELRDAGFTDA